MPALHATLESGGPGRGRTGDLLIVSINVELTDFSQ